MWILRIKVIFFILYHVDANGLTDYISTYSHSRPEINSSSLPFKKVLVSQNNGTDEIINATDVAIIENGFDDFSSHQIIVDMSRYNSVRLLSITDRSFSYTYGFIVDELKNLEVLRIEDSCFIHQKTKKRSLSELDKIKLNCVIRNCYRLQEIVIGMGAFSNYNAFQLFNIPILRTVRIGDVAFGDTEHIVLKGTYLVI